MAQSRFRGQVRMDADWRCIYAPYLLAMVMIDAKTEIVSHIFLPAHRSQIGTYKVQNSRVECRARPNYSDE